MMLSMWKTMNLADNSGLQFDISICVFDYIYVGTSPYLPSSSRPSVCVGVCVCVDVSARACVYHTGLLCRGMINNNHNRIDQGGARWRRDGWFKMETDTRQAMEKTLTCIQQNWCTTVLYDMKETGR